MSDIRARLSAAELLRGAPSIGKGEKGDKGDKGDTGDVTPAAQAAMTAAQNAATSAVAAKNAAEAAANRAEAADSDSSNRTVTFTQGTEYALPASGEAFGSLTGKIVGDIAILKTGLDNVSGSGVYASDSTEAPPIDIALNADTLGGQGPSYYAKQAAVNQISTGLTTKSADGTHCTVYYNDAVAIIGFMATGLTLDGTTDTTTFALPQGYSLSGTNVVTTFALSNNWWPTANNVYLSISGSSVSMRATQSATGAVIACRVAVPRSILTISQ